MTHRMIDRNYDRWERAKARPTIYVAGPMTSSGNPYDNVRLGAVAGQRAYDLGWAPFVPHLSAISAMITGRHDWEEALEYDYVWVARSEALLLLPGHSLGASAEVDLAQYLKIPVFAGLSDLPTAEAFRSGVWRVQ